MVDVGRIQGETGGGSEEREGGSEVEWLGLSLMCPVIATEGKSKSDTFYK